MAWDFSTEPEFEKRLEWIRWFRAERVDPLDLVHPDRAFHPLDEETGPIVRALKQQVRDQGLWAPHLGPELGGRGFGQLKLALINGDAARDGRVVAEGDTVLVAAVAGDAQPDTAGAGREELLGVDTQGAGSTRPMWTRTTRPTCTAAGPWPRRGFRSPPGPTRRTGVPTPGR
ncbi:hypothetical protein ACFV2U_23365 [Streptomyces sp. NPDC059697]|uniref:hypothetical protein n=1 Tax=Streptomyces sp. NPDC059697 TaxID=3346912 RepID=UPI0036B3C7A7